jgi:ABC-type amino acid transport substrate-binding protein
VDKKGNIVGFDMDVMRMIAHLSGYEIKIKDLPYDSLLPALKAGKIGILAAETNITPERAKKGIFQIHTGWRTRQSWLLKIQLLPWQL